MNFALCLEMKYFYKSPEQFPSRIKNVPHFKLNEECLLQNSRQAV